MSERYIVGDKINLSTLPNQTYVFPNGVKPVGLRIYGDTKTAVTNSGLTFDVNETTGGAVVSTDIDISSVALDGYKDISTSELDEYFGTGYAAPRLHPRTSSTLYAPIFAVLTEDMAVYISEHIAKITIDGEQAVRFSRQHPYYGIYGEEIKASFDADFEDTDQGVYDTSATNTTIMSNYDQKDVIYIKGSGTIWVWAGNAPAEFPFKAQGKGGGSGGGTIYRTTTALTDGATTNPITVDGEPVTVKSGDFAIYNKAEFVFDGTQWDELGDTSGLGDLAYKDSASGTASVSVTGTTDGSVTISPTKETIYSTTNKGTLPSFTYNSTTEELTFNAGTLPSTTSKSVVTNATATFTGASTTSTGTVNVTVS